MEIARCKVSQIVSLLYIGSSQIGVFGGHVDTHQCVKKSDCLDLKGKRL